MPKPKMMIGNIDKQRVAIQRLYTRMSTIIYLAKMPVLRECEGRVMIFVTAISIPRSMSGMPEVIILTHRILTEARVKTESSLGSLKASPIKKVHF